MIFIFLGSVWKYPCLGKLFQKIKIVCWSWSLEARLTLTSKNRWWFSFFYFLDWKYSFWVNLDQKVKTVSLSWNWIPRLFWRWKIRWWCSLVLFSPFFQVLSKKSIWYFGVTLIIYRLVTRKDVWAFLFQLKDEISQASNAYFVSLVISTSLQFLFKL